MSGPKRNPDSLNTFGIVVVGICGAVLVYVSITALQAFYMNDTSEIQTMADYGGQDLTAKGHKADEMRNITETASNAVVPGAAPTFHISIRHAMELIAHEGASPSFDPSRMVPALPPSTTSTIQPKFGRPVPLTPPPPAAAAPAPGAGSGAGAASGSPLTMPPTNTGGVAGSSGRLGAPGGAAPSSSGAPGGAAGATGSGGHAP